MKIRELFDYVLQVKPHVFTDSVQLMWLNELEGRVQLDIFLLAPDALNKPYTLPEDEETELLVNTPHSSIYRYWMQAMIDLELGEYSKYQNDMQNFNAAWNEFACWFAETQGTEGDGVSRGFYLSAYGVAVKHGFTGTEEEWLASLKGEPFRYEDFTEEQLAAIKEGVVQDALDEAKNYAELARLDYEGAHVAKQKADSAADEARSSANWARNYEKNAEADAERSAEAAANAAASENAAGESAFAAGQSANEASAYMYEAKGAAAAAGASENNAKLSEAAAKEAKDQAEQTLQNARLSATQASRSAGEAFASEQKAANSSGWAWESEQNANAAKNAAEGYARNAEADANRAEGYAEEARELAERMDMDTLLSAIAAKGDNLWVDPVTQLLYLTSGGEKIGDGVSIVTGGGGGGGGLDNNAVLSLVNKTGWIYKTLAHGAPCVLAAAATSLEDGMQTGPLILKITVNNVTKTTMEIAQGDFTIDVGPWLDVGACVVKMNVTDTYGNSRTLNFNITTVSLILESSFDATVPYTGEIAYTYTPTGSAEKTVHFLVDGEEIDTATVVASGRQQSFTIPAQSHGSHLFEVYFDATVDGETVESNHLRYDIMCLESGNTAPVISMPYWATKAEQFELLNIPYIVYNPAGLTADIEQLVNGESVKNLTVDRTQQVWAYRPDTDGELTLAIKCGDTVKPVTLTVTKSALDVEAETEALGLYLTAYGRSNNEADPGIWESGDVAASLTGFNFASDGWQTDEDGVTVLRVAGDARVEIPYQIFAQDFRTTGKTIEVEFATRDVLNYDAPVITCYSGGRGLKITAQRADINSEQSSIGTQYKEDEHVRLAFVVEKRTAHRLLLVYINGILSGAVQYPTDDDFSQAQPVGISIGSNDCTTDIYCIRIYDNDLTRYQVLDNWIADTQVLSVKAERYQRNNVYDDYGQIVIAKLPSDLPYLVLNAAKLPEYKGNELTVRGSYTDPLDNAKSFTFEGAQADVQGTSSAGYARKNYKIDFAGGFTHDGKTTEDYQLGNAVPTNVFTFKADVASSEGANNVELVKLYCDITPFKIPPQLTDPRVRQGIDGYPIVIFHNNGAETVFIGKYNFNHDKGTPEVFGLDTGDESWETKNNTSARALWKSADYTGKDWQNDFEARYPKKNTNVVNLQALAAWIVSTDTEQATGEALAAAVTYGDVQYTHDTAEYRLAKFDAELGDWLEEESTIFYYLFTELFLMIDSRTKNSFPTRYDGDKWCWLPYDMDTAIGIDNMGELTFGYELEDIDTVKGDPVYNGQNSVLWKNLRATRFEQIRAMYQQLRSDGLLSYDDVEKRYEKHQAKWPEAIFNEDAYYKYLEPLFRDGTGSYLAMLQGSKAEQRKWWLYNRFRYIDSKYNAGDAQKDFITLRGYAKSDITITPYADIYAAILFGSYLVQKRALRKDGSQTLEYPMDTAKETETYIYSASQIADIGDLSGYEVGYADFSAGTKLQRIKLGDAAASYRNLHLDTLYLGNNVLLKTLDVRNCPNLGTGEQKSVDISGCTNIEHIYFDGTAIAGLTLPNGGIIKTLHLPETVTNLTIRNQPGIIDFYMPGYSNITTLRLEGITDAIPGRQILAGMTANSRVRLINFDWSFDSAMQILAMMDKLDTMRGLDENGSNVDKAQVGGIVRVDQLTELELTEMQRRYPDVTVVYQKVGSQVVDLIERTLAGKYVNEQVTTVRRNAFRACVLLTALDFSKVSKIRSEAFNECEALDTLILRNTEQVCTLENTNAFYKTQVFTGGGCIYVPAALIEQYKAATNWSTFADRFRAIEDYPDITG